MINGADENPTFNYIDLGVTYSFRPGLNLTLGVNNIMDKEPPLGPSLSGNDFGPGWYGTYDPLGRAIYTNLQFQF